MTEYTCGHKTDGVIILDDNVLSLSAWFEWRETTGYLGNKSECFDCYCKK